MLFGRTQFRKMSKWNTEKFSFLLLKLWKHAKLSLNEFFSWNHFFSSHNAMWRKLRKKIRSLRKSFMKPNTKNPSLLLLYPMLNFSFTVKISSNQLFSNFCQKWVRVNFHIVCFNNHIWKIFREFVGSFANHY